MKAVDSLRARLDAIEALVAELSGRQCEIIRLLLTPQGLRDSDACGPRTRFPGGKR